jgi:periplasmic protein TonB
VVSNQEDLWKVALSASQLKSKPMNPKEILRADLLDIIFDNRNKTYGAYALRKHYDKRLFKSLIIGLTTTAGICLVVHFTHSGSDTCIVEDLGGDGVVTVIEIPKHKPLEPEARVVPQLKRASRAYSSTFQIVEDNQALSDMPTIDELEHNLIDNVDRDGVEPTPDHTPVQSTQPLASVSEEKYTEAVLIQKQPEFPGGKAAWKKFLERHLRAPDELAFGERKTVQVKFLVSEDGSITQFAVIQSGGEAFDNEVIRVLKKMPKWSPAVQNGRNVAVTFTQPVTFQSVEE